MLGRGTRVRDADKEGMLFDMSGVLSLPVNVKEDGGGRCPLFPFGFIHSHFCSCSIQVRPQMLMIPFEGYN